MGRLVAPTLAESAAAAGGDSGPVDRTCVLTSESPRAVSALEDTLMLRPDLTARFRGSSRASWLRLGDPLRSCRGTPPQTIEMRTMRAG